MVLNTADNQRIVNEIRITLSQVMIDLRGVRVQDQYSHGTRERAVDYLRKIGNMMDRLGLKHVCAPSKERGENSR